MYRGLTYMALGCSIFIAIGTFSWVLHGRAVLLLQSWTGYWGQILAHCGRGLGSVSKGFRASIGGAFILPRGLGAGPYFYGI